MKPSDRINEIYDRFKEGYPNLSRLSNYLEAIIKYLDETWEEDQKARQELKDKLVDLD